MIDPFQFLGNDFDQMPVSEREKLVFNIINENSKQNQFEHDVRYEDIMNLSNSKQNSSTPNAGITNI